MRARTLPDLFFKTLLLLCSSFFCLHTEIRANSNLPDSLCSKHDRFGLDSATTLLVDNHGLGFDSLSGVRNFRVVLHDVLYRGGGDNLYLRPSQKRSYFRNPLPLNGITNLRKAGFTKGIYLYSKNFKERYPDNILDSLKESGFIYSSEPELIDSSLKVFFSDIKARIDDPSKGPVYIHCWNGWHQSGLLSTLTLMQFCGLNNRQGLEYWVQCTDGNGAGYPHVREKILNYKPFNEFLITEVQKQIFCPCLNRGILEAGTDTLALNSDTLSGSEKPAAPVPGKKEKPRYHTVVKGDTLSSIAARHSIPLSKLLSLNRMRPTDIIRPKQKIRIR